jgi:PAS domain S-box-containing protein
MDEQLRSYIETIQQQMVAWSHEVSEQTTKLSESKMALEGLQLIYEEMQSRLAAMEATEERLLQQQQQLATNCQYYYDLFQAAPVAYLVTDTSGLILEANQTVAALLNMPQSYLLGKPLAIFVGSSDRSAFRTYLNQLSRSNQRQQWQLQLTPRQQASFMAELQVAVIRNYAGWVESLRIAVYDLSQVQRAQPVLAVSEQTVIAVSTLPLSLDGLQVLVVDDEADAREFITTVLEAHGVYVTAVATAAAALEVLEHSQPDLLVSDIRMPHEDGYSLIQKVRELGAKQGWHLPAAALTAYLTEDREKVLTAGFEAHLHKLAQPSELIEMVAQLAKAKPSS